MIKKALLLLLMTLYGTFAQSNSCSELLLSGPMFQLTNTLAVGDVTIHNFDQLELKSVIFNRWVYLSPYDAHTEHVSIGLTSEGELYLLNTNSERQLGSDQAWLLSGTLKIKEFSITGTRFLSVMGEDEKTYTVDNDFVESALVKINYLTLSEFIFGRTWPTEGFLREVNAENGEELERLIVEPFLEEMDDFE